MTRNQLIQQARHELDSGALAATLARRVAWRTESDLGADATESSRAALQGYLSDEMSPVLQALGFEVQILPNPVPDAGPFLLARRIEDPAAPTLLTYGHGDVVNGQKPQ